MGSNPLQTKMSTFLFTSIVLSSETLKFDFFYIIVSLRISNHCNLRQNKISAFFLSKKRSEFNHIFRASSAA